MPIFDRKNLSKYYRLLFAICACLAYYSPQAQVMRGEVVDSLDREPLIGAIVYCIEKDTFLVTDTDGSFSLATSKGRLIVSSPGYATKQVFCDGGQTCQIALAPDTLVQLPAIVVKARSKKRESATAIYSLNRREADQLISFGVQEALSAFPAIQMEQGAWNTNRISFRGIGSRTPFSTSKLRVYLDDIPLTNGIGESTLEDFDPAIFESIEIHPGPEPGQHGAALGGTILLRSLNRSAWPQHKVKTDWRIGSFGRLRGSHSLHWKDSDSKHMLALQLHHMHSDGFRENNEYDRRGVDLFYRYYISQGHQIQILGSLVDLKAFIPSSLNLEDFRLNPGKAAESWAIVNGYEDYTRGLAAISYQGRLSQKWSIGSSIFYSDRGADESRPFNFLDEKSRRFGNRTRITFCDSIGKVGLRGHTGWEWFRENHDWGTWTPLNFRPKNRLTVNEEIRRYSNLFTEWIIQPGRHWDLTTGLTASRTRYRLRRTFSIDGSDPSGDYTFDWIISPRVGVVYHGVIDQNILFDAFTRISHGLSAPTLEETLTPDGLINPDIQPETGWSSEVGIRAFHRKERWSLQVNYYRMWVRNLLVARRTNFDQFIGINAGKTLHKGLETSFSWTSPVWNSDKSNGFLSGRFSYHYADYKFVTFVDDETDYSGNDLTGNAPHNFWGMVRLMTEFGQNIRPWVQFSSRYQSRRPVADNNEFYTDPWWLHSVRIGIIWHPDKQQDWKVEASVSVDNLADTNYPAMLQINAPAIGGNLPRYFYPGAPRNYTGQLSLSRQF